MEQIKVFSSTSDIVTLVAIPKLLSILMWPHVGYYDNPYILRTIPCEKRDGRFFDLRSGEEVQKGDGMLEWKNLTGTVFCYPDGQRVLISRKFFADRSYLALSIDAAEFRPETMCLRPVITEAKVKLR